MFQCSFNHNAKYEQCNALRIHASLFATATTLAPMSFTMAMILLVGILVPTNLISSYNLLQPLCNARCIMSILQWHGGETERMHVPVICNVMAGNRLRHVSIPKSN